MAIIQVATSRKQVTNRHQMVFDSQLQLCDPWNTAYNRKRKQEHF